MLKGDFVQAVAAKAGLNQKQAKAAVDAALDVITESLAAGESVKLTGFGVFEVRERSERNGINPQTGAKMIVPASKVAGFSASHPLKRAVRGA